MPDKYENPYERGSARWKLKQRQINDRRKKEAAEAPPPKPKEKEDKTNRRKYLDEAINSMSMRSVDAAVNQRVAKLRDNQSTDTNNA